MRDDVWGAARVSSSGQRAGVREVTGLRLGIPRKYDTIRILKMLNHKEGATCDGSGLWGSQGDWLSRCGSGEWEVCCLALHVAAEITEWIQSAQVALSRIILTLSYSPSQMVTSPNMTSEEGEVRGKR